MPAWSDHDVRPGLRSRAASRTVTDVPKDPDNIRQARRVARRYEKARMERDATILQLHNEGVGLRTIGRLFGLNHQTVANLIARREDGE